MANHVIIVRHGQSVGNVDETFYQYHDSAVSLTPEGIRQCVTAANTIKRYFVNGPFAWKGRHFFPFVSEYTRAQHTSKIVLEHLGCAGYTPQITPFLNELNVGTADVKYDMLKTNFSSKATDGESINELHQRVAHWWDSVEPLLSAGNVFVFSHAGTSRALLGRLLDLSVDQAWQIKVKNASPLILKRTTDILAGRPRTTYQWMEPEAAPLGYVKDH